MACEKTLATDDVALRSGMKNYMKNLFSDIIDLPSVAWRKWRELTRKLWVRVVLMGLLSFVSLGFANLVGSFVPDKLASYVSGAAADRLLGIIANAMLAVTTFSLTVMVTVYRSSSNQFTPRLHRLIVRDKTTQNTLAAFIGAYVYALTGIILRELQIFGDDRAALLFLMTVLVLIYVVVSMIRWVLHLQSFGSLINISRQLEDITQQQFDDRLNMPCLGANEWDGTAPDAAKPILALKTGYVQQVYQESLQSHARENDLDIYLDANVGAFVLKGEPLVLVSAKNGKLEAELIEKIISCVPVADLRIYDQDPRFGLMALGEIASKALSPGVNDPGTSIDVLTRQIRILLSYVDNSVDTQDVTHENLWVRALDPHDLVQDAFGAWTRDGVAVIEVQERLQKTLAKLANHASPAMCKAATVFAQTAYDRSIEALSFADDRRRLDDAVGQNIKTRTAKA